MDGDKKKKDEVGAADGSTSSKEVTSAAKSESMSSVKVKEEPTASTTSSTSSTPSKSEKDVKSEPKTSSGASGASGGAGGGSEDMSDMDEAAMRKALQDYMALAQTANALQSAQQAQQMALLLQAYGPQAMAYLQAASVTGKPLANMMSSLAMLQQAQQQQQQAAAMSMLPKRGRGSRGGVGSRGGRGGANAANLKLKRLDSSELLGGGGGRGGGGRGRGVRGRRRLEGSYSNDFLYYMNEGGIRSGTAQVLNAQCGNFRIFLPLRFYVKSKLTVLEIAILQFRRLFILIFSKF